jgi:hypothetical protein
MIKEHTGTKPPTNTRRQGKLQKISKKLISNKQQQLFLPAVEKIRE